jgi:hypothetical protein
MIKQIEAKCAACDDIHIDKPSSGDGIEGKLLTIERLFAKQLITKEEFDRKRNEIISEI